MLDSEEFMHVVNELQEKGALLVHGLHETLSKEHVYLLPYNGVIFYIKSREPLPLKASIEAEN